MNTFDRLIAICLSQNATDVHFSVGQHPICRINGDLVRLERLGFLSDKDIQEFIELSVPKDKMPEFEDRRQIDYAYQTQDGVRLRCNAFLQQESHAMAVRILNNNECTIDALGLPQVLYSICNSMSGLVLVTGPTGSGKSTTLAAMVHYINSERSCHILTIEDPIEYKHESLKALVNQREV
ncbi:MAG TPA: type IV pili twitching motility protein PilT, partial [Ruminococcaceae bacterium]|nr:type IV pili twitching motility protein PilT [Oscillospiraceae bacterium]